MMESRCLKPAFLFYRVAAPVGEGTLFLFMFVKSIVGTAQLPSSSCLG